MVSKKKKVIEKKSKEKKESILEPIEKTYPSVVLGLDISTTCIGVSVVYDDGVNKPEIIEITHLKPNIKKIKKNAKGIEALILRKEVFEKDFLPKIIKYNITECVIESPLNYATGNSNATTVSQLLQFNGLISESIYRVLGIVPYYIGSRDARMISFPQLMAIRKFNKKGEQYSVKEIERSIKNNHLVLFGSFPFDCDKKVVMMNMVNDMYDGIQWQFDKNGELTKENYDACDSLVCVLAYVNRKKYGNLETSICEYNKEENTDGSIDFNYTITFWDKKICRKITM